MINPIIVTIQSKKIVNNLNYKMYEKILILETFNILISFLFILDNYHL